jgi:hypothetical protein
MKSFKQYLVEHNVDEENKYILLDCLRAIKTDCKQFLHRVASGGKFHPLYKSIKDEIWPQYEVKVRKGHLFLSQNKLINDSLIRVFDELYNKSFETSAIFASGKPIGNTHLIFPIGKFDFLWSSKEKNLYDALSDSDSDLYFDIHDGLDDGKKDKASKAFIKDLDLIYNEDLRKCILSDNQALIGCKYYYAIPLKMITDNIQLVKDTLGEINL